jgi:hypothetical protein
MHAERVFLNKIAENVSFVSVFEKWWFENVDISGCVFNFKG